MRRCVSIQATQLTNINAPDHAPGTEPVFLEETREETWDPELFGKWDKSSVFHQCDGTEEKERRFWVPETDRHSKVGVKESRSNSRSYLPANHTCACTYTHTPVCIQTHMYTHTHVIRKRSCKLTPRVEEWTNVTVSTTATLVKRHTLCWVASLNPPKSSKGRRSFYCSV